MSCVIINIMQTTSYERINILVPKEIAKKLRKTVPHGQRSKLVSEAIEEKLNKVNLSKKDWYKKLLEVRKSGPKVSWEEVVEWVRKDRQSH